MNLKIMALVAVVSGALMAFAGPAAATTLTGAGGAPLGSGTTIDAEGEGTTVFHLPFAVVECQKSVFSGNTLNTGSSTETVKGKRKDSFSFCSAFVTVLAYETFEIHTSGSTANNNGRWTSTGLEITIETFGTHCQYKTSSTEIGTLTGSANTGANATLDISATLPRTGGRSGAFCGSTAAWTGSYKVTNPSTLNVD